MILGTAQGCNQWKPYEYCRAMKGYEALVCRSSTGGVFFMLAWGGRHDPRCHFTGAARGGLQNFFLEKWVRRACGPRIAG